MTRVVLGCVMVLMAASAPALTQPPPQADKSPPAPTDEDVAAKKARLTKLDQDIAAREKELAELRLQASELRRLIAAGKDPKVEVLRRSAQLVDDLPKSAYPMMGSTGSIERAATARWLKYNALGRVFEWKATVKEIAIKGTGPFSVYITTTKDMDAIDQRIKLGTVPCQVYLYSGGGIENLRYDDCTEQVARELRQLKGREVTIRATTIPDESGGVIVRDTQLDGRNDDPRILISVRTRTTIPELLPLFQSSDYESRGRLRG